MSSYSFVQGGLLHPGIESRSLHDSLPSEPPGKPHCLHSWLLDPFFFFFLIDLVNLPDSTLSMDSEKSLPFGLEFEGPVGI